MPVHPRHGRRVPCGGVAAAAAAAPAGAFLPQAQRGSSGGVQPLREGEVAPLWPIIRRRALQAWTKHLKEVALQQEAHATRLRWAWQSLAALLSCRAQSCRRTAAHRLSLFVTASRGPTSVRDFTRESTSRGPAGRVLLTRKFSGAFRKPFLFELFETPGRKGKDNVRKTRLPCICVTG